MVWGGDQPVTTFNSNIGPIKGEQTVADIGLDQQGAAQSEPNTTKGGLQCKVAALKLGANAGGDLVQGTSFEVLCPRQACVVVLGAYIAQ